MCDYLQPRYLWKTLSGLLPPKKIINFQGSEELAHKRNSFFGDLNAKDFLTGCKECQGIKLFPHEEVLDVQRQHKITLLMPLAVTVAFIIITGGSVIVYFQYLFTNPVFTPGVLLPVIAIFLVFIQMFATYTFLYWYYQFYIITNKRLIHVCLFRIGGFHLDEVFHQQSSPIEIDSRPSNIILDLLDIEDLYVYFQRFERPEPFIFLSPENHIKIEQILENHSLEEMWNE